MTYLELLGVKQNRYGWQEHMLQLLMGGGNLTIRSFGQIIPFPGSCPNILHCSIIQGKLVTHALIAYWLNYGTPST